MRWAGSGWVLGAWRDLMVAGRYRERITASMGCFGKAQNSVVFMSQPAKLAPRALLSAVANALHGGRGDGFCKHTWAPVLCMSRPAIMIAAQNKPSPARCVADQGVPSNVLPGHLLCLLQGKGLIGAAAPEEGSDESEQTAAGPSSSSPEAATDENGTGTASTDSSSSSSGAVTGQKRKRSHSDIKLLALDMDGTLLSSESKVLSSSVKAIKVWARLAVAVRAVANMMRGSRSMCLAGGAPCPAAVASRLPAVATHGQAGARCSHQSLWKSLKVWR